MPTLVKQFTFVADTNIQPNQVNANFDDIVAFLNNNTVHTDGTRAMTAALALPGTDPTSDNQAARKAYVDAKAAAVDAHPEAAAAQTSADRKARGHGSQGTITGGAAPDWNVTQLLVQGGRFDLTTNGAGDATITFPAAFPNNLWSIAVNSLIADRNFYITVHDTGNRFAVAIRVYKHDGSVHANLATTVCYVAIGW